MRTEKEIAWIGSCILLLLQARKDDPPVWLQKRKGLL